MTLRARSAALALALLWTGCVSAEDDHPPPPPSARSPDPPPDVGEVPPDEPGEPVAPRLTPPPARGGLDRDQVVAVARRHADPQDAIAVLDQSPFTFRLDAKAVGWFGEQGLDAAVLDYLDKRSKIDWAALRGDVDPDHPGD